MRRPEIRDCPLCDQEFYTTHANQVYCDDCRKNRPREVRRYSRHHDYEHEDYRRQALVAARELRYGKKFIDRIKKAKDESEIQRIMITARREKYDDQ